MTSLQAKARMFIHDIVCMSGCEGTQAEGHARRTQATFGRDAIRAHKAGDSLEQVLHDHLCIVHRMDHCPDRDDHVERYRALAGQLAHRLE